MIFSIFLILSLCMDKSSDQQKYNKSEQKLLKKIQANILDIIDPKNEIGRKISGKNTRSI